MYFSGFCDEAGKHIDTQIKAHKELGFTHVELRAVQINEYGGQFTDVSDADFDEICGKLADAGLKVSCFGSAIANWSRHICQDWSIDMEDLKRSIPRMKKLGTEFIRVMSWPNNGEKIFLHDEWKEEAIKRMKELAKVAEDGGIILALENCDGWAAKAPENMVEFIEAVDSKALRVVFDTGNSPGHDLNSLEFYTAVKPYISYIHIKDAYKDTDGVAHFTYPNEGCGYVRQILRDLLRDGYDGGFSIEPHLKAQAHLGSEVADKDEVGYRIYIEYGNRLRKLVEEIKRSLKSEI
ncbi:MAG: sugar phosphate isomerase/epimerase family protein [Planctomycetota bacterium]|jgi:sugar phosphate isomerase/epimerase